MELAFRAVLLGWLAADPALSANLNAIAEEAPSRTALPWLALTASASSDWSTKTEPGREVRVALELNYRGDDPLAESALIAAIERRAESLPADQTAAGFRIASLMFLKARAEQRGEARRALVLEYRARLMAA
ncbi:DUF3168 domain-containing protein [Novosphingobium sp. KCTC 2891]|uniref:DUF3168 domain-containing protein n=1 Tax=Novosphingobium sp. KCTC 2891 TaxID=2989730 RepID=UPI0022239781|nr:DUF3168 domain-containing protein [Novosphingobium sp. KCTC 2891]MCW1383212.1 DUF3168 domain-containing protein [Novosphingobium sp. KCTC 2891]